MISFHAFSVASAFLRPSWDPRTGLIGKSSSNLCANPIPVSKYALRFSINFYNNFFIVKEDRYELHTYSYDFAIEDDPYRDLIKKIGSKKKEYRWCNWVNPQMISQQKDYKQFQGSRLWSYLRELVEGQGNNKNGLFDDFKKNLYVTDQLKIKLEKRKIISKIKSDEKGLNKERKLDKKELNKQMRRIFNGNLELMIEILKDELKLIQPKLIILMGNSLFSQVFEDYSSIITIIIPHEANFNRIINSYQSDIPLHFNILADFSAEICESIRNRTELIQNIKFALS